MIFQKTENGQLIETQVNPKTREKIIPGHGYNKLILTREDMEIIRKLSYKELKKYVNCLANHFYTWEEIKNNPIYEKN